MRPNLWGTATWLTVIGGVPAIAASLVSSPDGRHGDDRLQWVFRPASSGEGLREDLQDLWPFIAIAPERTRFIQIGDPYLTHEHYLMVRTGSASEPQDPGRPTVTFLGPPIELRLARPAFRDDAWLVGRPLRKEASVDGFTDLTALIEIPATGQDRAFRQIMARWDYYLRENLRTVNTLLNAKRAELRLIAIVAVFALLFVLALAAVHLRRRRNRIAIEVKEHALAKQSLHESERRFRDLVESAQLVAIMIDLGNRISFCNDYALSITGWTRDEVVGHRADEFLDAGYLGQLADAMEGSRTACQPLALLEGSIRSRDGERRWIRWTSAVLRDTSGRPAGFASLGEDATELKRLRAEAAIRESEERFSAIFQHVAVGVAQVDLKGNVILANDRCCEILDTTRRELEGKSFRCPTGPGRPEPQLTRLGDLVAGEVPNFSFDERCVRRDGSVRWASVQASLVRDHDDRPKHFVVVLEDITARKETEAALREGKERFRNMVDAAPAMIWIAGPDKLCVFFNRGWLTFTGRTMAEELRDGWDHGLYPGDLKRCTATFDSAFDSRRKFQMEYRRRSADGEYRWVRDEAIPRFGPDGGFAGYIGSCIDVTDVKCAHEEALARWERESVCVPSGGVARVFNNLLGSIVEDLQLAMADLTAGFAVSEGVERIHSVALSAEMVRELLAYTGKENAVFEPIDLSQLVGDMIHLLKLSIAKRAILNVDLPGDLPAIRANSGQMRQVVLNLVTNASESLGREDGVITVSAARARIEPHSPHGGEFDLPEGEYLRLRVCDTGCGMTQDVGARTFDPLLTTKLTGRDLELAVVKGIIRGHGGVIDVVSEPGGGTRFEIMLPSIGEPSGQAGSVAASASDSDGGGAAGTVLFVEDEHSLRVPVCQMLRKKGYIVIEAGDGVAAVELFRANQASIDVVLLDMTLPGMSGPDVHRELLRFRPGIQVVLTTAYSQETALTSFAGHPAWAFIRKPYRIDDLSKLLQKACLEHRRIVSRAEAESG